MIQHRCTVMADISSMRPDPVAYRQDGFSLLELVVAVSIMLILGVVGFVAYQNYTDNARQAATDMVASEVLTAAIAAGNTPGGDPTDAVKDYHTHAEDIVANITEADQHGMTITAVDSKGTTSVAQVTGDYSNVKTTAFSEPGVTYRWAGKPHHSASIKYRHGQPVEQNTFPGPKFNSVGAYNDRSHAINEYTGTIKNTGTTTVHDGRVTVDTTIPAGEGRYGVWAPPFIGYSTDDVVRVTFTSDLAEGHRVGVYIDEYDVNEKFLGARSAYFYDSNSEPQTAELPIRENSVYMKVFFWIEAWDPTDPAPSTATFWNPYVGPADGEYFDGEQQ